MELANPGFGQFEDKADFFHSQLFIIVQGKNQLLFFRQPLDGILEDIPEFALGQDRKGVTPVDVLQDLVAAVLFAVIGRQVRCSTT